MHTRVPGGFVSYGYICLLFRLGGGCQLEKKKKALRCNRKGIFGATSTGVYEAIVTGLLRASFVLLALRRTLRFELSNDRP